ncbi:MAG: NUDIX domain-containing protein [Acidimicrobiia bacterium]|nr:NUDIX domain-containing protein [Acidimicrobiia bacterium]
MRPRLHRLALRCYRLLPDNVRRWGVRVMTPNYSVGAMCVIERDDGRILLVRQAYRQRWGTPGGLLQRREPAATAAKREVAEEVGFDISLVGEPAVVVAERAQRVDLVYRARLAPGQDPDDATARSAEIVDVGWFSPDALPDLQHETASALVALARSARSPQAPLLAAVPDVESRRVE